jgi:hypothetical protein
MACDGKHCDNSEIDSNQACNGENDCDVCDFMMVSSIPFTLLPFTLSRKGHFTCVAYESHWMNTRSTQAVGVGCRDWRN